MSEYEVTTDVQKEEWQLKNQARHHIFFADEPQEDGTDAGPNPVEYLTGAVNSCIAMSAGMIIKSRKMAVNHFRVTTQATTKDLGHAQSIVSQMVINISFNSSLTDQEKQDFVDFILHVSTVYQTVSKSVKMKVNIA